MKIALGIFIVFFVCCVFFIALAPDFVHEVIDRIHGDSDKRPEDTDPQLSETEDTAPRFSRKINRYGVSDIDFSPDGKFIAVASELGIELYNAQTYDKVAFFEDKNDGIRDAPAKFEHHYMIMFSPDGQMLASANGTYNNDRLSIRLWSVEEKREIVTFKNDASVYALAFSPDGRTLAVGSDDTIRLWSVEEKREIVTFKNDASVYALAFSPDGRTLAVGSGDDTIRLWSISERREFAMCGESFGREGYAHRAKIGVFSVRFSPDGQMLAGEEDGIVSFWSFPEGDHLLHIGVGMAPMSMGWLWSISFSPDMKMLASGHYDGTIRLWVVPEKHEITPELMRELEQWTAEDPLEITSLKKEQSGVNCLAFSPDGRTLISGHESGTVQIWNIPSTYQILLRTGKSKPQK